MKSTRLKIRLVSWASIVTTCFILNACGGSSQSSRHQDSQMGGVDVGNPGVTTSAYVAQYRSVYGYNLKYDSNLKLVQPSLDHVVLHSSQNKSAAEFKIANPDGTPKTENDLKELMASVGDAKDFHLEVGKNGEIVYSRDVAEKGVTHRMAFYLTPQKNILTLDAYLNDQDPGTDEIAGAVQSIKFNLTPPTIRKIEMNNEGKRGSLPELVVAVSGLLSQETPSFSMLVKKLGDPAAQAIKIVPSFMRVSESDFRLILNPEEPLPAGTYIVSFFAVYDQARNSDVLWMFPGSSTYADIRVPANRNFMEVAAESWKPANFGKLEFTQQ